MHLHLATKRGFIYSVSGVRMFESLFEFKDDAAPDGTLSTGSNYYKDNETRIDASVVLRPRRWRSRCKSSSGAPR